MYISLQICCTELLYSTVQMFFHAQINLFAQPQQSRDHRATLQKKHETNLFQNQGHTQTHTYTERGITTDAPWRIFLTLKICLIERKHKRNNQVGYGGSALPKNKNYEVNH